MPYVILHTGTLALLESTLTESLNSLDRSEAQLTEVLKQRDVLILKLAAARVAAEGIAYAYKDLRDAYDELYSEHNSMIKDHTLL